MGIFYRRPLFFLCTVFMLASLVGLALPASLTWLAMAAAVAAGGLVGWFSLRQKCRSRVALSVIACVLACLALLQSHLAWEGPTATYLKSLEHKTVLVEATVTDRRGAGGNLTSYTLSLDTVNGRKTEGLAVLTCYYVSELQPGFEVELEGILIPLEEAVGDGYDATGLVGDGYVTGILSEEETTVNVLQRKSDDLRVRAGKLRRTLAARLNLLTGDEAKGLPAALLLGDRAALGDDLRRDFARSGVSHLLAISGLHMTLLFGLLGGLLGLLRVPKRLRAILLGCGVLGYLLLLGFPPSATRAAVMLGVTYLSYLLSEKSDPLTSLGVAGALILLVTPRAVADAGFWMSYLATLGILTVLPLLTPWLNRLSDGGSHPLLRVLGRPLAALASAVAVGLVAMSFTLTVVAAVIGELGILSPLSTLLLTPFCAVLALLSLLCLLCMETPVGPVLGHMARSVAVLMDELAAVMAEPSWVVVSLRHPAVLPVAILMLFGVMTLLAVRLPSRRRWLVLLPFLVGWGTIGGILGIHSHLTCDEVAVTYLQPSSVSEDLVMVAGHQGFICDLSNGSLSSMNTAVREAEIGGATEIAVLMLTHYHGRTSGSLSTLLARETVRELWMPEPKTQEEYYLLLSCLEKAETAEVPVFLYENGIPLQVFGEGTITLETATLARSVQPVLLLSLDVSQRHTGRDQLVYCGSAVFESALAERAATAVATADRVIFGSHGPLIKAAYGEELDLGQVQEIIFSAHGDAAAWFAADHSRNIPMWMGPKRFTLYR